MLVSTTNEIFGHRIIRQFSVVRGIALRAREPCAPGRGASDATLMRYFDFAERARQAALDHLIVRATAAGANAVIGMRYTSSDITDEVSEVMAYGTAVKVGGYAPAERLYRESSRAVA
jgi:uncharacterized protein YbjQ (UPF0145 family)